MNIEQQLVEMSSKERLSIYETEVCKRAASLIRECRAAGFIDEKGEAASTNTVDRRTLLGMGDAGTIHVGNAIYVVPLELSVAYRALAADAERWKREAMAARELLDNARVVNERFFYSLFGINVNIGLYESWKSVRTANAAENGCAS